MSELALKLIEENKKTRAKFLDLGNCGLTGIPEELAELEWLEEISFASKWFDFDGNQWDFKSSGNVGSENRFVSPASSRTTIFSKENNLIKLWLNNTQFEQLNLLSGLTRLQWLDLSGNQVRKISTLSGLCELQWLFICDTPVSDLSPLACLTKLQRLDAFNTPIVDLSPLATLYSLRNLDLYNTSISELGPLTSLVDLQRLDIAHTLVEDITPLANLKSLQRLNISNTRISDLKPVSEVFGLQELDISDTDIRDIKPLSGMSNLQHLRAFSTEISDLYPLYALTELKVLFIDNTPVHDISPLGALLNLKQLEISDTKITDISPLTTLTNLKELNVANTSIIDISPLTSLVSLQKLNISRTQVKNIYPLISLHNLQRINLAKSQVSDISPIRHLFEKGIVTYLSKEWFQDDGIFLGGCPLTNPPVEIVEKGNEAILNYLREKQSQGIDQLYEAKLLIIGEGGAGKTSLLRRLYQTDQPLPDERESTKGIDIFRHDFTLKNGRSFRLNVWDFGGQEIYHATHQFFLTKRSLYILLDDTRKDDKSVHDVGFKYWLELVDFLSDHSPVLVFQNEKAGRSKTIDQSGIKGRFDNVKDFYRGNLQQACSTDALREAIEFYAQQLPHTGEQLPAKWVVIRAELEELAEHQPYISQQAYFDIYASHLEFDRNKALYLSEYLHDLGVFLHFQHDPLLARTVILQNQWATEAVFKILDDEIVKARQGRFDTTDCRRLWQDSVYADMHPELLALMQKFELCYRLPDQSSKTWLAPQLLSPSRPVALSFVNQPNDLVLRYHYPFLPKGLISRLIVRMHRFVKQPDLSWSSGALFEQNENALLAEIPEKAAKLYYAPMARNVNHY